MNRPHSILKHRPYLSVIIHNLHVRRTFLSPSEANAELVVYANAVLTLTFALQRLQVIARWRAQKIQSMSCIKLRQLPNRDVCNARKPLTPSGFKQCLRISTTEAIDHIIRL